MEANTNVPVTPPPDPIPPSQNTPITDVVPPMQPKESKPSNALPQADSAATTPNPKMPIKPTSTFNSTVVVVVIVVVIVIAALAIYAYIKGKH